MSRPRKCRKVCCLPEIIEFIPISHTDKQCAPVILTVDEYETIRLIDKLGLSQEECSKYMEIARTTAQLIYNNARKKLALALVDGLPLKISGGNFELCDGKKELSWCSGCRHRQHRMKLIQKEDIENDNSSTG